MLLVFPNKAIWGPKGTLSNCTGAKGTIEEPIVIPAVIFLQYNVTDFHMSAGIPRITCVQIELEQYFEPPGDLVTMQTLNSFHLGWGLEVHISSQPPEAIDAADSCSI